MTRFKIFLDVDPDTKEVNPASFDGHVTADDVRDREDEQGRLLFSAIAHASATGSIGAFVSRGDQMVYVERES